MASARKATNTSAPNAIPTIAPVDSLLDLEDVPEVEFDSDVGTGVTVTAVVVPVGVRVTVAPILVLVPVILTP